MLAAITMMATLKITRAHATAHFFAAAFLF